MTVAAVENQVSPPLTPDAVGYAPRLKGTGVRAVMLKEFFAA
jgi:hypothetical protein